VGIAPAKSRKCHTIVIGSNWLRWTRQPVPLFQAIKILSLFGIILRSGPLRFSVCLLWAGLFGKILFLNRQGGVCPEPGIRGTGGNEVASVLVRNPPRFSAPACLGTWDADPWNWKRIFHGNSVLGRRKYKRVTNSSRLAAIDGAPDVFCRTTVVERRVWQPRKRVSEDFSYLFTV
jgi:hypothetical protein